MKLQWNIGTFNFTVVFLPPKQGVSEATTLSLMQRLPETTAFYFLLFLLIADAYNHSLVFYFH